MHGHNIIYLFTCWWNFWVSNFALFRIKLLWTLVYKYLCAHMHSFLCGKYLREKGWIMKVYVCLFLLCVWAGTARGVLVEVRRKLGGLGSFLQPLYRFQALDSGLQACVGCASPADPVHCPFPQPWLHSCVCVWFLPTILSGIWGSLILVILLV